MRENHAADSVPGAPHRLPPALVHVAISALLVLVVGAAFWPALENGFVWDDRENFLDNERYRGLAPENLKWMVTNLTGHWIPVVWLSFGLDYTLWGMNPRGYHVTNLILHAANAVLFYFLTLALLRRSKGAGGTALFGVAALGALFFALHPFRVEVVAWVTERRELLSGLFTLLTVLAYVRMVEGPKRRTWLALSVVCFVLALMCKTMVMALPVALLILDAFLFNRFTPGARARVLIEKIPFAVPMVAAVVVTLITTAKAGALVSGADYPLLDQVLQPGFRFLFYIQKTVVPLDLSPLYAFRHVPGPAEAGFWVYLMCGLGALAGTVALLRFRRRVPELLSAWLCYGVMISPVLGLGVQGGPHFAADRYTYVACMPWALLFAAACLRFRRTSAAVPISAALVTAGLAVMTFGQTHIWKDNLSLWTYAIQIEPHSFSHFNRGVARQERGDFDGAIEDYSRAIELNSDLADAYNNRGLLRYKRGEFQDAMNDTTRAIELSPPGSPFPYNSRGLVKMALGDPMGAIEDYTRAIKRFSEFPEAYFNRGIAHLAREDSESALNDFTAAVEHNPRYVEAHVNRGTLLLGQEQLDEAFNAFTKAIEINPGFSGAYYNRGLVWERRGHWQGAIKDYTAAILTDPKNGLAYSRRSMLWLETRGEWYKSMADVNKAIQFLPNSYEDYMRRGIMWITRGNGKLSSEDLQKALDLAPPDWPLRPMIERTLKRAQDIR